MNYSSDASYGGDWVISLPNVPAQVNADSSRLHAIVNKVEHFFLRFSLWSTRNNYWHRAAFDNFSEVVTVVCFDDASADFS